VEVWAVNPTAEWYWEGNVQAALVAKLKADGWAIVGQADTASRQQGPDVEARRGSTPLLLEVKGYPSTVYVRGERAGQPKPTEPALQARHWFSEALSTTILRKEDFPQAQLAVVFPEVSTYLRLIERSAWALKALGIWVYIVGQGGVVRTMTFSDLG
jgi:hypothetical protein